MKVFLSGGSGMLGSAILRLNSDFDITAPSREKLDLKDQKAVQSYFEVHDFDAILHCAAKVGGIKANIADQTSFFANNVLMNTNLIEAARQNGIQKFINIGSSCMYPKDIDRPISEEDLLRAPLEPTNEGYALAKIGAARLCQYISEQYGYHYKTLIPCNLYGPGDHYDLELSHMLAAAILKLHQAKENNADHVTIWGDGLARREFIYVDDLAHFILRSVSTIENLPSLLNLGLGRDFTVNEYYEFVREALGFEGGLRHDLTQPIGMRQKLMNSSKAHHLGWTPKTSILDGIRMSYINFLKGFDDHSAKT